MWGWYLFSFGISSKKICDEPAYHKQLISSVWKLMLNPVNFSLPRIIPNHDLQVEVTFFRDFLSRYEKISHQTSFGKLHSNTLDASKFDSIIFLICSPINKGKNELCRNVKKLEADSVKAEI